MKKCLIVAGIALTVASPIWAQQATPPVELRGIPSAGEGISAQRLAFEYFKASPDALLNAAKVTILPGKSISMHIHQGPEYHYVIAGELEETIGNGAPRMLKVGDGAFVPEGTPHTLKNLSSTPASFIAVIVGRKGEPLTKPHH